MQSPVTRILALAAVAATLTLSAHAADQWTTPTLDELKMTEQPQVPGASAVVLQHDEVMDDTLHYWSFYERVKILNDAGKSYGDVELPYVHYSDGGGYSIRAISGRTIHADGTIIPFNGKAYDKLVSKEGDEKRSAKVFSMPDVQVGSIIEYRYQLSYGDELFIEPHWDLQTPLFARQLHYSWKASNRTLRDAKSGRLINGVSWATLLPHGTQVTNTSETVIGGLPGALTQVYDLKMQDVPPLPKGKYLPPLSNFSFHVYFYYAAYDTRDEFWKAEGKSWSKDMDKFIGPDNIITTAAKGLVAPDDTPEAKLKKIYAAVETIENTDFTRARSEQEERANGDARAQSAADILQRKRGTSDQIAALFVGMARAAGMKAYVMGVVNRRSRIFDPMYMSLSQIDDDLAIVNVGGKEQFFDPGSRYCPYGHLAWDHTSVAGIRQTEDGISLTQVTPGEPYTFSHTQRVADLALAPDGSVSGPITFVYTGSPALEWRQRALATDDAGIHESLKKSLEQMLPTGMDVHVDNIDRLTDYESPLKITYTVKGMLGSMTGKRLILPGDLFEATATPTFTEEKRDNVIYFHYAYVSQDAQRFKLPAGFTVESAPKPVQNPYQKSAMYSYAVESTPAAVTTRREFDMADTIIPTAEYGALKTYYSQMEQKDQESVVLLLPGVASK